MSENACLPVDSSRRRWLVAGTAVAAGATGAGWWAWQQRQASDESTAGLWTTFFMRPDGSAMNLAAWRGQPLLLNFWAPWCAPCRRELPDMSRFYETYRRHGWQVVALALDSAEAVQQFLREVPLAFPVALAGLAGSDWMRELGNAPGGLPFSVALGRNGRVLWRKTGETHFDELSRLAQQAD